MFVNQPIRLAWLQNSKYQITASYFGLKTFLVTTALLTQIANAHTMLSLFGIKIVCILQAWFGHALLIFRGSLVIRQNEPKIEEPNL